MELTLTNVQILLVVNFLHSTCSGLIVPLISPHVINIGGNHIIVGFLITGYITCQMLSKDFVALFEHGRKFMLTFCLFTSFLCHLLLAITTSLWIVVLARYIFALVNDVDSCSKDFIEKTEPKENRDKIFNLIDILKTLGFVIGAVVGGYIYDNNNDFESNAMIASLLTLSGVMLVQRIDRDPPGKKIKSRIPTLPQECYKQLSNLTKIDYKQNWDAFVLKIAYVTAFTIFFAKYASLIRYNYKIGVIVVGYTVAYQNMLVFASKSIVPYLKVKLERFPMELVFQHSLLTCAVTLTGIYYAPTYDCYLIIFIPMIISYNLANCLFDDDALNLELNPDLFRAINTLTSIINISVPFLFGIVYHVIGAQAFKLTAILPPAVCAYVVNQRLTTLKRENKDE